MPKSAPRDRVSNRIPEWRLQAEVIADLHKRIEGGQQFEFAASLEGVRLNPHQAQIAKATGMQAGEVDLRLYFAGARIVMCELKGDKGYLSADQKERLPKLHALGFVIHLCKAKTPEAMVELIGAIVDAELSGTSDHLPTRWLPK